MSATNTAVDLMGGSYGARLCGSIRRTAMNITDEAADAAWSAFTSLGVYASDKARLTKALEAALPHLSQGAVSGMTVRAAIKEALRELDNVTAFSDEDANCLGCAENLLRQALSALSPAPVGVTDEGQLPTRAKSAEARILELETDLEIANDLIRKKDEALRNIRELNMTGSDENGHRWADSDLIEQEIVFALGGQSNE